MQLHIYEYGSGGPVILWGMFPHREDELAHTVECVEELVGDKSFLLVAYQVEDWNRQFSLWKTDELDGSFAGGAAQTLAWLEDELIPQIKISYGKAEEYYLAGYSLAGLFSLWAAYESDFFAGAACCSGSLWYPGFLDYTKTHYMSENKKIYLSLGGREEKTKDPLISTVGVCTREIYNSLGHVSATKYEMNSGGHFADSGKRIAKGVRWLLEDKPNICQN